MFIAAVVGEAVGPQKGVGKKETGKLAIKWWPGTAYRYIFISHHTTWPPSCTLWISSSHRSMSSNNSVTLLLHFKTSLLVIPVAELP